MELGPCDIVVKLNKIESIGESENEYDMVLNASSSFFEAGSKGMNGMIETIRTLRGE